MTAAALRGYDVRTRSHEYYLNVSHISRLAKEISLMASQAVDLRGICSGMVHHQVTTHKHPHCLCTWYELYYIRV